MASPPRRGARASAVGGAGAGLRARPPRCRCAQGLNLIARRGWQRRAGGGAPSLQVVHIHGEVPQGPRLPVAAPRRRARHHGRVGEAARRGAFWEAASAARGGGGGRGRGGRQRRSKRGGRGEKRRRRGGWQRGRQRQRGQPGGRRRGRRASRGPRRFIFRFRHFARAARAVAGPDGGEACGAGASAGALSPAQVRRGFS